MQQERSTDQSRILYIGDQPMKISTISGTAKNGKNARVLIQRHDLAQYGFDCYQPITVTFNVECHQIEIYADHDGSRKVSCVLDKRRNVTYQTIDLRIPHELRADLFDGADKLSVSATSGVLIIVGA